MRAKSPKQRLSILLVVLLASHSIYNAEAITTRTGLNPSVADQEAADSRTTACEGVDIKYSMMSDRELEVQRNKDLNLFSRSTGLLKQIISTQDFNLLWDGELWLPILITFIFVCSIISIVLYAVNICICCDRKRTALNEFCVKLNLCFAVLSFVIFLVAIIGMAIFITNARSSISYVNCAINIMNDDIRNGGFYPAALTVADSDTKMDISFQGFLPMKNIFVEYGKSLTNIVNNHTQNINNIIAETIPTKSKEAYDAIAPYVTKFGSSMTSNSAGVMTKPLSVTTILPTNRDPIEAEFAALYSTSIKVHDAALVAKTVIDTGDAAIFQSAIESANTELEAILKQIDKYISLSNSYFGTVNDQYDTVQILYVVFNFICLVIGVIIAIGLCLAFRQDKCTHFLLWRIMILIIGILCVFFFAVTFFIASISFLTSSSCQIIGELHTTEGIDSFVSTFKISDRFSTILKTCYSQSSDGDVGRVFLNTNAGNSPEFQVFNDSKKLLSVYSEYAKQVTKMDPNGDSVNTQKLDDDLEKVRIGISIDQTGITEALVALNALVACDNIYYVLTPNTCKTAETKTCRSIQVDLAVAEPACLVGAGTAQLDTAKLTFTNLKKYLTETQALMTSMIDEANGTNPDSLNSKYKVAARSFLNTTTLFDKIKEEQKSAIALFNGDLAAQTDCRIIRLHMQLIEDSICFKSVAELYSFMVASLVASIFFFCLVWNLCCAEYCIGNLKEGFDEVEEEESGPYANQEVTPVIQTHQQNEVAEDDFFVHSTQGGYMNNSESSGNQDQNIEYQVKQDDLNAPENYIVKEQNVLDESDSKDKHQ